jgi:tRNA pseudouridine55 synthase
MPLEGFLNLLKPPGMTSHDVVAGVRRRLGTKRVGHLGTLDPAAAGVLPISLGRATRLFSFAGGRDKAYRAEVMFGFSTDTLDAEGVVIAEQDSSGLSRAALEELCASFVGEATQVPPAFSAVKIGGRRLYELAREGKIPQPRARTVRILSLSLVDFAPGPRARAVIDVVCTAGTYLRVLAADLGQSAGPGACLAFLVRTRVGRFELARAVTPEEFEAACERDDVVRYAVPSDWPLQDLPQVDVDGRAARSFATGRRVRTDRDDAWPVKAYGPGRCFLGLGEIAAGALMPRVVLVEEGDCSA